MSDADKAEIAKADTFPAWTPGAPTAIILSGRITSRPRSRPERTRTKGKVVSFTFNEAESKFYPDTGKASWRATRHVTVYIPSQYVPGTPAPFIVSADAYGATDIA